MLSMHGKISNSYSSVDRKVTFEIFQLLEAHECGVWLDFSDIKPSETLEKELKGNVQNTDVARILLSPTSAALPVG